MPSFCPVPTVKYLQPPDSNSAMQRRWHSSAETNPVAIFSRDRVERVASYIFAPRPPLHAMLIPRTVGAISAGTDAVASRATARPVSCQFATYKVIRLRMTSSCLPKRKADIKQVSSSCPADCTTHSGRGETSQRSHADESGPSPMSTKQKGPGTTSILLRQESLRGPFE